MYTQKYIISFLILIKSTLLYSQSVIATGISKDGSVNWTIGEVVSETITGNENVLTQGFYQPRFIVSGGNGISDNERMILVYLNTKGDLLTIKYNNYNHLSFSLLTIQGIVLQREYINNNETKIPLNRFPGGIYLLLIKRNNQIVKSFKVVKP